MAEKDLEQEVKETLETEETTKEEKVSETCCEETKGETCCEEETKEEAKEFKEEKPKKERTLKWTAKAKEEKKEAKSKEQEALAEANDKYARLFAEFDNFRKRSEKEKSARYDMGAKDMIEKVLPVLDSFELALKNIPENEKDSPFVEGMEKIQKQFLKALEDAGVTPIDAVGKEFDPEFHNAVMHVEDENIGENIVVEELQKGYLYKEHVVRYSMVKVAN